MRHGQGEQHHTAPHWAQAQCHKRLTADRITRYSRRDLWCLFATQACAQRGLICIRLICVVVLCIWSARDRNLAQAQRSSSNQQIWLLGLERAGTVVRRPDHPDPDMAEGPPSSLNDFFKKDKKKKIKGSNLNNSMNDKPEEKKEQKKKTEEDDGWHEEEVVQATMKVEVAGKLVREEEKEKEEEAVAPAWGVIKNKGTSDPKDDKRYPSLAKSVASSAIHLEDKSGQVNIATSKNIFATLENDDDDEDGPKRPKDIKPALVSKKKGEREKDAIQREVSKYKDPKKDDKEDDHDAEEDAEKEVKPKKKDEKNEKKVKSSALKESSKAPEQNFEDLQIQPDHAAVKSKYIGRKKLPKKPLPPEELEEEKENKPQRPVGKKKWAQIDEEEEEIEYVDKFEVD